MYKLYIKDSMKNLKKIGSGRTFNSAVKNAVNNKKIEMIHDIEEVINHVIENSDYVMVYE